MAERRMFAKTIVDSDAFLDMPSTARLLYYDLGMRADDDGFVNSPKKIMRMTGASEDDLRILAARKFIIPFDIGVVVIKHWRIHNYIRKDTYNETPYKEQKSLLELDENNAYRLCDGESLPPSLPPVDEPSTQVRLGKVRKGKDSIVKNKYLDFVKLSCDEHAKLIEKYGEEKTNGCIEILNNYLGAKGDKYKSHYHAILSWVAERYDKDHRFDLPKGDVEVWG